MQRGAFVTALFFGAAATSAHAQVVGPDLGLGQKAAVTFSGFWAHVNSVARADGSGGLVGTRLDFEQDLGLDENDFRPVFALRYQFNRRHGVELSYFNLNRSAERTLGLDVDFRDQVYARETTLHTSFDTEIWRLSYFYAFLDTERHRATAQIGVHYARLDALLERPEGTNAQDASADAPLPVIGLGYAYRFSPRWMAELRAQIFRLEVDQVNGRINNFSAVVGVAPSRHVSVFAGYNYYQMNVEISKRFWEGSAKFDYRGPWVGFVVGFGGES